jgi:hypothetical protein
MNGISRVPTQGNSCFLAATLHEFAEVGYLEQTLSKKLTQAKEEDSFSFCQRERLQSRLRHVVQKMKRGEDICVHEINGIKDSLVDVGFLLRLNLIQKILLRIFPGVVQYHTGDTFKLYNTIRLLCEEQDIHLGPHQFYKQLEGTPPPHSIVHTFTHPVDELSIPQSHDFLLKVNLNHIKRPTEPLKNKLGIKQLQFLQCTVPNKILGYHTLCFVKRNQRWYCCNGLQITKSNFQSIEKISQNAILHLHYF